MTHTQKSPTCTSWHPLGSSGHGNARGLVGEGLLSCVVARLVFATVVNVFQAWGELRYFPGWETKDDPEPHPDAAKPRLRNKPMKESPRVQWWPIPISVPPTEEGAI